MLGLAAFVGWRGYQAQRELRLAAAGFRDLLNAPRPQGAGQLATALSLLPQLAPPCGHLVRGVDAGGFLVAPLRILVFVPALRGWGEVPDVLQFGRSLCLMRDDGQALLDGAAAAAMANRQGLSAVPELLDGLEPTLARLGAHAGEALAAQERLDARDFRGPLAPLARPVERLAPLGPRLALARDLAPRAPHLAKLALGIPKPNTYLLLVQNDAEIRATGGFVGALGPVTVQGGKITAVDVRSSYDWDAPTSPSVSPPGPLVRYMNFGAWFIRDANWWPDYPRSAREARRFWQERGGPPLDGVIAIDHQALHGVLRALGGVEVAELGGLVTADTAESRMDQRRRTLEQTAGKTWDPAKNEVLGSVYRAVLDKVLTASATQLSNLAVALLDSLQHKHVLADLDDGDLKEALAKLGWDGRVEPGDGDALEVVDTTVSYGKVAPYLRQSGRYERDPRGEVALSLTYANTFKPTPGAPWDVVVNGTYWNWKAGIFQREQGAWLGYVRVLVPEGAQLVSATGWDEQPTAGQETPRFVTIGGPLMVRPGATRTVALRYRLPGTLRRAPLRLIAQPGAPDLALDVALPGRAAQQVTLAGRDVVVFA